jgi:RNA polymerase sigma-70 factor, ECF subfamily
VAGFSSDSFVATRTTTRLLDALREPSNEPAWAHIDARYRAVIAGLARRLGLGEADAEEVAQQTLSEFVKAYRDGRYDREKGRLSSWILGIAHHHTLRMFRSGKREVTPGASQMTEAVDEKSLRSMWTDERDREIFSQALTLLRDATDIDDRTLQAFELVSLRAVPATAVAEQCGMSVEQVYVAKSRVTKRLRTVVEDLTRAFEEDA